MEVGTVRMTPKEVAEALRDHVAAKFGNTPTAIEVIDPWGKAPLVISFNTHGREHRWESSDTRQVTQG
jgi:hypothetical protein